MSNFNLKNIIKRAFSQSPITTEQQEELDKELKLAAHNAGYRLTEQPDGGLSRIFHREFDDMTLKVPCKEHLEKRDRYLLYAFDAYL